MSTTIKIGNIGGDFSGNIAGGNITQHTQHNKTEVIYLDREKRSAGAAIETYQPLRIRISPRTEAGYPVELEIEGKQQFRAVLPADVAETVQSLSAKKCGERLFELLLDQPKIQAGWAESRGQSAQRRVRLQIDEQAPELHALPWEMMADQGRPLAADRNTPFSRYLALPDRPLPLIESRPLKMLVVIANPEDLEDYNLAEINIDEEKANLRTAAAGESELELTFLDELSLDAGQSTISQLNQALQEGYHLLHVVAHGQYSRRKKMNTLYLNDREGWTKTVSEDKLSELFQQLGDKKPHLICLASCNSSTQNSTDALRGVAPALVKAGVPAVVAMQSEVTIATAQTFSRTFYRNLLRHGQLDLALNEARGELLTAQLRDANLPVLFSRLSDNQLFEPTNIANDDSASSGLQKSTQGLSGDLFRDIKDVLLECKEIYEFGQLLALFKIDTLRPWRSRLGKSNNAEGQVNLLIDNLVDQFNVQQENALVLFLRQLSRQYASSTHQHRNLTILANQLAQAKQRNN